MIRSSLLMFAVLSILAMSAQAQSPEWRQLPVSFAQDDDVIACDSGGGLYALTQNISVSHDDGQTWTTSLLLCDAQWIAGGYRRGEALIAGRVPSYTKDAGATWHPIPTQAAGRLCATGKDGWYYGCSYNTLSASQYLDHGWVTHSFDGQIIWMWTGLSGELSIAATTANDTAVWRSADHGATWKRYCSLPDIYIGDAISESGSGEMSFWGTAGESWYSSDFGQSWVRRQGHTYFVGGYTFQSDFERRTTYEYHGVTLVAPIEIDRMCRSTTGRIFGRAESFIPGSQYGSTFAIPDGTPLAIFPADDTTRIAESADHFFGDSMDSAGYYYRRMYNVGGKVGIYSHHDSILWVALNVPAIFELKCAPDGTVYASGANGIVYHTTDHGRTWTESIAGTGDLIRLSISPSGQLFTANSDGALYRSKDGSQWSQVGSTPAHLRELYATSTGLVAFCEDHNIRSIQRSSDFGITWSPLSVPEKNLNYADVLPNGLVLAATPQHLYYFHGSEWIDFTSGLPARLPDDTLPTLSTLGHDARGYIYVGVVNGSIWKTSVPVERLSVPSSPTDGGNCVSVFPNPSSGNVSVEIPNDATAVTLLDEVGREVLSVEGAQVHSGTLKFERLTPGVYVLRVRGGKTCFARFVVQ